MTMTSSDPINASLFILRNSSTASKRQQADPSCDEQKRDAADAFAICQLNLNHLLLQKQ